jgi:hypothetical protein
VFGADGDGVAPGAGMPATGGAEGSAGAGIAIDPPPPPGIGKGRGAWTAPVLAQAGRHAAAATMTSMRACPP